MVGDDRGPRGGTPQDKGSAIAGSKTRRCEERRSKTGATKDVKDRGRVCTPSALRDEARGVQEGVNIDLVVATTAWAPAAQTRTMSGARGMA